MTTVTYTLPAVHCGHCVHTVQMEVGELAGVQSVKVDQESKQAVITYDAPATEDSIIAILKEINYPPAGQDLIQLN
ncbi:MAG: heavy-metal-associated domain-containing protein [Anaerolineae bacterium]|nr:heavy-metal-associated domain-containing protein [Anaerolineae bacterium]